MLSTLQEEVIFMGYFSNVKAAFAIVGKLLKSGDITGGVIALAIAAIITIGVGIPITQQVIDSSNLTGITSTVVSFIPVMMAVALLLAAVGVMRGQN